MLTLGPLAFAAPWLLAGFAALPLLWWLLRVFPPAPRRLRFPAIRLLLGLKETEETAEATPWWLVLLRLALAALVILALAHPLINPAPPLDRSGPLVLVIDDGWAAAEHWRDRIALADRLLEQAERENRPAVLVTTSVRSQRAAAPEPAPASEVRGRLRAIEPRPWATDRAAAAARLSALSGTDAAEVVWIADGITDPEPVAPGGKRPATVLAEMAAALGPVLYARDMAIRPVVVLDPPETTGDGLELTLRRRTALGPATYWTRLSADDGRTLARAPVAFAQSDLEASAEMVVPLELRNAASRLSVDGVASAAGVILLDERWRRRVVGVVSGGALEEAQPLLDDIYYVRKALKPFAEVRTGTTTELLEGGLSVLVLADVGRIVGADLGGLEQWVADGGVLVRFAGPRLAQVEDTLSPVRLRRGGRALGGALSWETPARLAPFGEDSPFFGLDVPPDVLVRRQVLAEPAPDLAGRTWASLEDGTPLVTAERRGRGWVILFHVTANPRWSTLPLSGLYVGMLERVVGLSQAAQSPGAPETDAAPARGRLAPSAVLDGFGRLMEPGPTVRPVAGDTVSIVVGPEHPPGYYGRRDMRRAINLQADGLSLNPLAMPPKVTETTFAAKPELDLKPWLLSLAILLALADGVAALALRGLLPVPTLRRAGMATLLAGLVYLAGAAGSSAQETDERIALAATLETRLAYVITGERAVDELSRAGLVGLSAVLGERTAFEPGDPMGIRVETDELVFYPLLYWPMTEEPPQISDTAIRKIAAYMQNGGTILFDTRDHQVAFEGLPRGYGNETSARTRSLRAILLRLDIPPLVPVPEDHVLTKAFYLMQAFPGRYSGGRVWVEAPPDPEGVALGEDAASDGVSSLIIGPNDWAAAWAVDDEARAMAAVVPGGERQREMAYRFGVNTVMYALTGNYKADQVHVPALLERLGQ